MGEVFLNFADAEPLAVTELDRAGLPSLFDRYEWFSRTLAECPLDGTPLIARASQADAHAWLFLTRDARGRAQGLSSWYTLAFRPVFRGSPDAVVRHDLLMQIARQLADHASSIDLAPMPADDCGRTADAFRAAGWIALTAETGCNWSIDVRGQSFADYWAARPGQLRKTVKSKGARVDMRVEIHQRFDAGAWADYEAVYADSWKPEEGAARFLRAMAVSEGAAGTLRLGIGRIDGVAVAAQLWTCENGTAIAHKVAHRRSAAAHSPGSLLSAAMFEQAIDRDDVARIDFGTGDNPYKTAWMDDRAPLYTLTLFNRKSPAALLRATRMQTGRALRQYR